MRSWDDVVNSHKYLIPFEIDSVEIQMIGLLGAGGLVPFKEEILTLNSASNTVTSLVCEDIVAGRRNIY